MICLMGRSGWRFTISLTACASISRRWPTPNLPADTLEHLLLDQVLPRALSHTGRIVLHASAVALNGRAIAFLGDAGWGKSTLTAGLCASGMALVSDDCLAIVAAEGDPILGVGSYPGMRLWPDSVSALGATADQTGRVAHYSRKARVAVVDADGHGRIGYHAGPLPIEGLYLLAPPDTDPPPDAVVITPLPARERVVRLLEYSFRLDIADRARGAREFLALTSLAERLPMHRLRYPRRYDVLPDVAAALRAHSMRLQADGSA